MGRVGHLAVGLAAARLWRAPEGVGAAQWRVGLVVATLLPDADLIAAERMAALDGLAADLKRTISFLQPERVIAFQQVARERIAALAELRRPCPRSERRSAVIPAPLAAAPPSSTWPPRGLPGGPASR